ncbi:MAG: spore germination protein, partial [Bacillota bacterium]|nr:spore germination protein [Bacillota bacterium]
PLVIWARPEFVTDVSRKDLMDQIRLRLMTAQNAIEVESLSDVADQLLQGHSILFIEGIASAMAIETKGWTSRGIEKPAAESTVLGPQVSLSEIIRDSIALIRLRLRSADLVIQRMQLGRKSVTDVVVLYLDGIAPPEIVKEVRRRLESLDVDMVLDTSELRQMMSDHPFSFLEGGRLTERPDTVAAELNDGRVAIIANNSPNALIVPNNYFMAFEAADDRYINPLAASLFRLIRQTAVLISLFGTAAYVGIVTFHHELIPLPLLLNIAATQEGVPFPLGLTAILTEAVMEILREAGVRLPQQFGGAVSIVGALVLGQAAIQAGFVPPGLVIVVTLGTIASFAVPRSERIISARIIRYPLIVLASIWGFYGVMLGVTIFIYHLSSLKSLGVPAFELYRPGEVGRLSIKLAMPPPHLQPSTRPLARHDKVRRGKLPKPRDPKQNAKGSDRERPD